MMARLLLAGAVILFLWRRTLNPDYYPDPFDEMTGKANDIPDPADDDKPADELEIADKVSPSVRRTLIAEFGEHYGGTGEAWRLRRNHILHELAVIERAVDYDLRTMDLRNSAAWHIR